MNAFTISESALAEIQAIFRQSQCREPVARLYERADAGHLFNDLESGFLGGKKSQEELEAIGKKRFEEVEDQLKSSLVIGACERADYRAEDLIEIRGITFVMGLEVPEILRECELIFENGSFLLRTADGAAHTLRSLAARFAS